MNLVEFVATFGVTVFRTLLVRYFTFQPMVFDSTTTPANYYDFIVVGAGCGGSVVASRLSETNATVLLLEAGGSAPPETAIPLIAAAKLFELETWDYQFKSQKNEFLGYTDSSTKFSTGKMMGGTSTIGGQVYTRGNKLDFDNWARMGNPGWDYHSVLPYFKKSEKYNDHKVPVDEKYHGFKGPLAVQRKSISSKLLEQFFEAGRQMGYSVIDPNGAQQLGGSPAYITVREGISATASESFVAPVVGRPNLLVKTDATVRRVLFNQSKRAVGVQYSINGKSHVVLARKEVILSAGAINSPKILMLSGVGPKQHLEEMGVHVVAAVEGVGKNLQDHPGPHLPFIVKSSAVSSPFELISMNSLKNYWTSQTGPFAEPQIGDGYFWLNVADQEHPDWTDIILGLPAISPATLGAEGTARRNNIRPEIFREVYDELSNGTVFAFWITLARPKSTGSITLSSSNPDATPVVEANVFDHPDDIKILIKGIRKAQELSNMPALKNVVAVKKLSRLLSPCRHYGGDSDAYWECYIRHVTAAGFHLTSSVKMAPPSDPLGVVSPRLRVRGVTGLRVIDASIMPQIVTVDPMAATYMIAEKGADMIKEDWGYPTERL